jgi:hypothetical protein
MARKAAVSSSVAQRTGARGSELAQRGAQVVEETIEVRRDPLTDQLLVHLDE